MTAAAFRLLQSAVGILRCLKRRIILRRNVALQRRSPPSIRILSTQLVAARTFLQGQHATQVCLPLNPIPCGTFAIRCLSGEPGQARAPQMFRQWSPPRTQRRSPAAVPYSRRSMSTTVSSENAEKLSAKLDSHTMLLPIPCKHQKITACSISVGEASA